jgi:hypothetical protein
MKMFTKSKDVEVMKFFWEVIFIQKFHLEPKEHLPSTSVFGEIAPWLKLEKRKFFIFQEID